LKEIVVDKPFYVVSDTHFSHVNIIKYCSRPFNNVDVMNETMYNNWCDKLENDDDLIFFLGDFANGDLKKNAKVFWDELPGTKYFIKGNHDLADNGIEMFDEVLVHFNNKRILLTHIPNSSKSKQYDFIFHGHIHNNGTPTPLPNNMINFSVEVNDYAPVLITTEFLNNKMMIDSTIR